MAASSSPNTIWTRRSLLAHTCHALQDAGIEDARRNAEWMLQSALGVSRAGLFADPAALVDDDTAREVLTMLARRLRREPLQYILGETDFYGLTIRVTPAVLIPRPETEQVVEHALALLAGTPAPRVLDIGTGSGCIPLAIKAQRPDAEVFACDVSEAALALAEQNSRDLGLSVAFLRADVLSDTFQQAVPGELDLLISNPPYIPDDEASALEPEVAAHEPHLALFSGDDPLRFYRAITHYAPALLKPGGALVYEVHADHGGAVRDLVRSAGFLNVQLLPDLAGWPRMVSGMWGLG